MIKPKIRQPIVTVAGHVDTGKTSLLDCFRGSSIQEGEVGGITQKISFTKYPLSQIKKVCPLIDKQKIAIDIPGFLFIDTPGHAAFTNLRKRGGTLADLTILVVNIKEGIKPQTAEVLQILRSNKTPFLIALNKIDNISGWKPFNGNTLKESIESQAINVSDEFQEALLTFQGSLSEYGFDSELYYDISDFTKKIALVPCSARTKEGIPELLLVLCGLSQGFLKEKLTLSNEGKGVILEIKKEKSVDSIESILYDGVLKEGDEIAIANFDSIIVTKIRSIEEIESLSFKYKNVKEVIAATGIKLHLTNREGILPGMPFQKINNNLDKIKESFKKELSLAIKTDPQGIIIKADSLGSLEALIFLLKQDNIQIVKAGIGPINKTDIISAKANLEINPLDSIILGFNVKLDEDTQADNIKILTNEVIYKLIEDLQVWRKQKQSNVEKERLMELATICKLEILPKFVFRNSNPAVFGVRVIAGKIKKGLPLIDQNNEEIARVKAIQSDKKSVEEALEGQEVAISLPGTTFDRKLKDIKFLYSQLGESQFKKFKQNKDLLSQSEIRALEDIANLKRRIKIDWGV